MMYQNPNLYYPYGMPFNPAFAVPPLLANSPPTGPLNAYPSFIPPMNQPSFRPGNTPYGSAPTSPQAMPIIQQPTAPSPEITSSQQKKENSSNQQQNNSPPQPALLFSNGTHGYR